jgi:hypothetical protein
MAFERLPQGYINHPETPPERIIKIEPIQKNKDGRIIRGDYPQEYMEAMPQYMSTPGILNVKDSHDILYDFRNMQIVIRLRRENTLDEEYTINNIIEENNMEAAAKGNNTRNKEGKYNNRILMNTAMTVSENTTKTIDGQQKKGGLFGWFGRK